MPLSAKFIAVISVLFFTTTSALSQTLQMPADEAREKAIAGAVIMVDIRSFDEVAETGLPDVALVADANAPNFVALLTAIQAQSPGAPLALMCRRGDCASEIEVQLSEAGVIGVIDIIAGFYGTREIAGWSRARLPIRNIDMPVSGLVAYRQP